MMVGGAAVIWDNKKNLRMEATTKDEGTLRVVCKDGKG